MAFKPSTINVGPKFAGASAPTVFATLSEPPPNKDEFETTAEYEKRVARRDGKSDVVAFVVTCVGWYDADHELFEVDVPVAGDRKVDARFPVDQRRRVTDSHAVQNAFGAVWTVTEVSEETYVLSAGPLSPVSTFFSVDRATAKQLKGDVGALLVYRLGPVDEKATSAEATFEHPTALTHRSLTMNGQLLEVWFYSKSTGTVLRKLGVVSHQRDRDLREIYTAPNLQRTSASPAQQ